MGTKFIANGNEINSSANNVNNIIYNDTQTLKGKLDEVDGEIVGINDDISRLKGYPYLQNTTISEYLDNNYPQSWSEYNNIRFVAAISDNVGDLPTSSVYHISATRNHGTSAWCLEATEIVTYGFKKFIGYKGYGNDIVWQELARKSDLDTKLSCKIVQFPQEASSKILKFSGQVQTRAVIAMLIISGQSGTLSPINISFGGGGGVEEISNYPVFISDTISTIYTQENATIYISQGIYGGWGYIRLLIFDPNLNVTIENA